MIPPAPPWTTDCCSSSQQSTPSHHWTATNHSRPREHPQWQSVAVLVLWQEESNASSWWLGVGRIQYGALWPESVEWRYSPLLSREQGGELAGGGGRIQVEKQWGEGGKKKRGRPLPLLSSFRLFPSLCLTALWPPSWFPAGPGVTWSLWAPGREPLRGVAGSARPLWREKRLLMPGCRVWLEQLHLRGKSQDDQQHILFSN